jgi:hypothetical protein
VPEAKKSEQKVRLVSGGPEEWDAIRNIMLIIQSVDDALVAAVKKVDNLSKYLKTPWGLSRGDRFHELKF